MLIGAEGELETLWELGELYGGEKFTATVLGGATRQESVRLGLEMVPVECDTVVVHDAARCCVTPDLISRTITSCPATVAIPVADTLRRTDGSLVDRTDLFTVQTPQVFPKDLLAQAHARAASDGYTGTDDASLIQRAGVKVNIAPGSPQNLKVTTPEDLKLAESILASRNSLAQENAPQPPVTGESTDAVPPLLGVRGQRFAGGQAPGDTLRIGQGYDVHQLAEGRECWLGGVHFSEAKLGPVGHSDADVLLHAICDALLGAAGLGDIGKLFPPSDMAHKDRRSIEFLEEVKVRLDENGWQVSNIDATVLAEAPKVLPRAAEIRSTIAEALDISFEQVSVKATTNEGLGFIGRGEGIAAHATALLRR